MSFEALEEAFERPTLTISTLRKFRKEHLQNLCEAKSIKILHGGKRVLKEKYVQALFNARPRESSPASKRRKRRCITRDDGSMLITLSSMLKLKLTRRDTEPPSPEIVLDNPAMDIDQRRDTEPLSPEIVLDNPAMDIDQGDANSPYPGGTGLRDVGSPQCLSLAHSAWPPFQQTPAALRPAIPSTNVEGLIGVVERKRKRAIASSSAKEPKAKKQKINKKYSDSRSILVRAFARRGEEFHVAEAEITLDSDGAFAVDYVAAKLLLKGTLYIIHPRNHYLYEPVSPHIVSWDEIEELQDFSGVLNVTFNEAYSKARREKRNITEFMC